MLGGGLLGDTQDISHLAIQGRSDYSPPDTGQGTTVEDLTPTTEKWREPATEEWGKADTEDTATTKSPLPPLDKTRGLANKLEAVTKRATAAKKVKDTKQAQATSLTSST